MTRIVQTTVYRRPLPDDLVAFSSTEGKRLFREALDAQTMEGWFALAEQFHTQADPSFCGLGSLVVALNALGVDPQRMWKGPWRWFSEELLDCCVSLDEVRARGLTLTELACLARCNGAEAIARHASDVDLATLRADVSAAAREGSSVVIGAYSRKGLGQTGGGHYSPLAGHHAARDLTLLLDVARFKYPPHWVSLDRLHEAMRAVDPDTGKSRGWIVLSRQQRAGGLLFSLTCKGSRWQDLVAKFDETSALLTASPASALEAYASIAPSLVQYLEWRAPVDARHGEWIARMKAALEASPAGRALADRGEDTATMAALFYAIDGGPLDDLEREVADELGRVREQLRALRTFEAGSSCEPR